MKKILLGYLILCLCLNILSCTTKNNSEDRNVLFFREHYGEMGWHNTGDEEKDGKYVGAIKKNEPHGQGIYTSAKGNKYVGKFKDGKRNGKGTFTKADGRKYEGEFRDDKFWNGKQYDKKGKLSEIHENGLEKTSFLKRLFK